MVFKDFDVQNQVALADLVDHVEPFDHAAETGVHAVQVRRIRAVHADEKLRSAGVLAAMRHRQYAPVVILFARRCLALDRIARTAGSGSLRTAALDHEIGNNAVERQPVVKARFGQFAEIVHRDRRFVVVKLDGHIPLLGMYDSFCHGLFFVIGNWSSQR